jgi:signal peptidase I
MIKRNPFISGGLSLLSPGLGQLYNGKPKHFFGFVIISFASIIIAITTEYYKSFYGYIILCLMTLSILTFSIILSISSSISIKNYVYKRYNNIFVYILAIVIISASFSFFTSSLFTIRYYKLLGNSMRNTLEASDRIIADETYYNRNKPKKGDIIIYLPMFDGNKTTMFLHRCVATEGDIVNIKNNRLFINGTNVIENYAIGNTNYFGYPNKNIIEGVVPKNHIIVLGDNREHAQDSRFLGYIPIKNIIGKASYILYSSKTEKIGNDL